MFSKSIMEDPPYNFIQAKAAVGYLLSELDHKSVGMTEQEFNSNISSMCSGSKETHASI